MSNITFQLWGEDWDDIEPIFFLLEYPVEYLKTMNIKQQTSFYNELLVSIHERYPDKRFVNVGMNVLLPKGYEKVINDHDEYIPQFIKLFKRKDSDEVSD